MIQSLPALLLAAAVLPSAQEQNTLAEARGAAFAAWANDSQTDAVNKLATEIRNAATQLNAEPTGESAFKLAAELEYSLIRLSTLASSMRNSGLVEKLLDGVTISPNFGGAFARLAWLREDCTEQLDLLVDWEIVGPFDNERGAGMESELPPQAKPNAPFYAGKVRPVSWRPVPDIPARMGRILLYRLIDPSSQVCAFARSWIESPEATTRILQIGFQQEMRIWLNGVPVFEALGEHRAGRDSFAVQLQLDAGWNELTVLIGAREGYPSFTARLADESTGAPARLRQVKQAPLGVAPRQLQTAPIDPSLSVTPPGVRRSLGLGETASDALTRSHLESFFRAAPTSTQPGRKSAKLACDLDPSSLAAHVQYALMLDEEGASEEQDVNPWLHAVDKVLELSPNLAWAWRQKAYHAGWNQPTYRRALRQLERTLESNPNSVLALELKAYLLEYLDQEALANRVREQILALPDIHNWPSVAGGCAKILPGADPKRLELKLAEFDATGDSNALTDWRWRTSRNSAPGDTGPFERVLARQLARTPWSISARLDAASYHLTLGNSERALELIAEAEAIAPDRAVIQYWRARAHLEAGETELAIIALERELELDYSAEDERRLLEHLRSTGSAPFHEAFQEPLLDVTARVTIDPEAAAQLPSREVILRRVVVKVNPDGTAKRYFRLVERVLSEAGARDRDAIRFSSYSNQELRVLTANVADTQGKVRRARTGRTGGSMLVDLPPLSVGDVIDVEWRIDDLRPTFFGNYFGFNETFSSDPTVPVHESEIVILTPDDFPLQFHTRGDVEAPTVSRTEDNLTQRRWITKAILPVDPERYMPPLEETMAAVQATSYESWEAFGAWWWNLTEEEIRVSPEMTAKVEELTRGKASALDKLRAIYDFVVTDIRYNAWEFGVHGYQPYEAPVIFSRGFGDCKDKAILLRAMLGEVDIEAWPVLIRAEQRRPNEDQELALVEHFNHCIAFIPEQAGIPEMFLDGTARHHPLEVLPAMDNGAKVLIVRADGVEQRTIPIAAAEQNRVESEFEVRVAVDRSAQVSVKRRSSGRFDPADRGRFTGSDEERIEQAQNIAVSLFGPIEGEVEATFSDLDNLSEDVSVNIELRAKQVARPNDKGFELPAALSKHNLLRTLASESERDTDLLIDVPRSSSTVIHYVLPPGSNPQSVPPAVHAESPDASYDWSAKIIEGGFEIREEFSIKTNRIPAANYDAFRELASKVDEAQNSMLEVEVKP